MTIVTSGHRSNENGVGSLVSFSLSPLFISFTLQRFFFLFYIFFLLILYLGWFSVSRQVVRQRYVARIIAFSNCRFLPHGGASFHRSLCPTMKPVSRKTFSSSPSKLFAPQGNPVEFNGRFQWTVEGKDTWKATLRGTSDTSKIVFSYVSPSASSISFSPALSIFLISFSFSFLSIIIIIISITINLVSLCYSLCEEIYQIRGPSRLIRSVRVCVLRRSSVTRAFQFIGYNPLEI